MKNNIYKLAAILVISSLAIVGCSDDESNPVNPMPEYGNVMTVHASPDAPGVDLLVDNTIVGENLTYSNNTPYLEVEAGTRNLKVNVTTTATTVIEANAPVSADKHYSVFAIDEVSELSAIFVEDDLSSPAAGNTHVRFIHLSPDAPAVDITLTDGTVVFGDYEFAEYSNFTPLPAGTYNLEVRLAGTSTVVLPLSNVSVMDGKIYTIYAKGFVSGMDEMALGAQIIVNN